MFDGNVPILLLQTHLFLVSVGTDRGKVVAPSEWFGPGNQHLDTKDIYCSIDCDLMKCSNFYRYKPVPFSSTCMSCEKYLAKNTRKHILHLLTVNLVGCQITLSRIIKSICLNFTSPISVKSILGKR